MEDAGVTDQVYGDPSQSQTMTVVLSDDQFSLLRSDLHEGTAWIVISLCVIVGMLLILAFWSGWRSTK